MSSTKLSSNYQIVVPKDVRVKLGLEKGQTLYIESVGKDSVSFTTVSPVDAYRGAFKDVFTEDAVEYQREVRRDRSLPGL